MRKLFILSGAMFIISSATHAQNLKDSTTYNSYYGKYTFEAGSPVDEGSIIWKDGALVLTTGMGDATMTMLGSDSFSMSYDNGTILFKRGDDKNVNQIVIMVSGTTLNGKKDAPGAMYADYYGKYKFEAGSPIDEATILWKDGSLSISTAIGDATMTLLGTDSFSMTYENGTIVFKRGNDKQVNQITISVAGTVLEGKKETAAGTSFRKRNLKDERKDVAAK